MKYQHLFFDLDHTLWDFDANARATLLHLYESLDLASRGMNDFDLFHRNYLLHNEKLWDRYRKGYIRQDELRLKRMRLALLDFKIADEKLAVELSEQFLEHLPTRNLLFPGTLETLEYLRKKGYAMHLITNGFNLTQHSKLLHSGLKDYFPHVITSETSNSLKPHRDIFEFAFRCCNAKADCSIMIGDNVEVDIIGAMNAGMDQVYVNYAGLQCEIKPTYTISRLEELKEFL